MIDYQWVIGLTYIYVIERVTGHIVKIFIIQSLTRYCDWARISIGKGVKRNPQKSETSGNIGLELNYGLSQIFDSNFTDYRKALGVLNC